MKREIFADDLTADAQPLREENQEGVQDVDIQGEDAGIEDANIEEINIKEGDVQE